MLDLLLLVALSVWLVVLTRRIHDIYRMVVTVDEKHTEALSKALTRRPGTSPPEVKEFGTRKIAVVPRPRNPNLARLSDARPVVAPRNQPRSRTTEVGS